MKKFIMFSTGCLILAGILLYLVYLAIYSGDESVRLILRIILVCLSAILAFVLLDEATNNNDPGYTGKSCDVCGDDIKIGEGKFYFFQDGSREDLCKICARVSVAVSPVGETKIK